MRVTLLPYELLLLIFRLVDYSDVTSIARVCKHFQSAATTFLYRSITIKGGATQGPGFIHPAAKLLRSLLSRPLLAHEIEGLTADFPRAYNTAASDTVWLVSGEPLTHAYHDSTSRNEIWPERASEAAEALLVDYGLSSTPWQTQLRSGRLNTIVGLIILCCRNLRTLQITSTYTSSTMISQIMRSICSRSTHKYLEEVSLGFDIKSTNDVHLHTANYRYLYDLMMLENMRSISIPLPFRELKTKSSSKSNLTSLVLHHTQLSEESLGVILRVTATLKHLQYSPCYYVGLNGSGRISSIGEYIDYEKLDASLDHVKNSLEELEIEINYFNAGLGVRGWEMRGLRGISNSSPNDFDQRGTLSGLPRFSQLRSVRVPLVILLGRCPGIAHLQDVLPPALDNLTLTHDILGKGYSDWTGADIMSEVSNTRHEFRHAQVRVPFLGSESVQD